MYAIENYARQIQALLEQSNYTITFPSPNDYRYAAAIALIEWIDAQPHLLFIERTRHILKNGKEANHSGQIAFPGGKIEQGETKIEAAYREAEEEVGIQQDRIEVLGKVGKFSTHVSGFLTTIYLAIAREHMSFERDPNEVADIFHVPVSVLLEQHNENLSVDNYANVLALHYHWFDAKKQKNICIWGMTGRATWCLLELLKKINFSADGTGLG